MTNARTFESRQKQLHPVQAKTLNMIKSCLAKQLNMVRNCFTLIRTVDV